MKIFVVIGSTDDGMVRDLVGAFPTRDAAAEFIGDEKDPENIYQYDDYDIEVTELVGVKGWV